MSTPSGAPQAPQSAPAPQYYGAPAEDPGKTLGIVGFVLAIVFSVAGIVVSAIARKKSREAGFDNQLAKWGLIVGIVLTVLATIFWILYFVVIAALIASGDLGTTY
ncbi:hypothetical protein [Oerskovia turbata]